MKLYSKAKKARWFLLNSSVNLTDDKTAALQQILEKHQMLATCYAMKEGMDSPFNFTNKKQTKKRLKAWFRAAKHSDIPQLKRFA